MKTLPTTPSRLSLNKKTITKFFSGKDLKSNANVYTVITVGTFAAENF